MSVSSEGDPEGGQGPGGVAGVVAQGGGEVDRPGPAQHADDQVAQEDVWAAEDASAEGPCRANTPAALRYPAGVRWSSGALHRAGEWALGMGRAGEQVQRSDIAEHEAVGRPAVAVQQ